MNLRRLKEIALSNDLSLHETDDGVLIFELHDHPKLMIVLVSADEGFSWAPETMGDQGKMWSGRTQLRHSFLASEIVDMYRELNLGSPQKMCAVAVQLMLADSEKTTH